MILIIIYLNKNGREIWRILGVILIGKDNLHDDDDSSCKFLALIYFNVLFIALRSEWSNAKFQIYFVIIFF